VNYTVEVTDVLKGIVVFTETFDNANTAYQVKRALDDSYQVWDTQQYVVRLIEPEDI